LIRCFGNKKRGKEKRFEGTGEMKLFFLPG